MTFSVFGAPFDSLCMQGWVGVGVVLCQVVLCCVVSRCVCDLQVPPEIFSEPPSCHMCRLFPLESTSPTFRLELQGGGGGASQRHPVSRWGGKRGKRGGEVGRWRKYVLAGGRRGGEVESQASGRSNKKHRLVKRFEFFQSALMQSWLQPPPP